MEIKDIQRKKDEKIVMTCRVLKKDRDFLKKNNISFTKLVNTAIEELRTPKKKRR